MKLQQYWDISQAADLDAFKRGLGTMAANMGFELFGALSVTEDPSNEKALATSSIHNMPSAYVNLAVSASRLKRDPVLKRLKNTAIPFLYHQDLYVREDAADLWEIQAPYGYKTGLAMALHMPNHQHFALGFDREGPLSPVQCTSKTLASFQLLVIHAQAAAARLMTPFFQPSLPKLSRREVEVLKWTMEGKTAWEVGTILGISERSAAFHASNSARKLDAVNKHQAALKAYQLGLLQLW